MNDMMKVVVSLSFSGSLLILVLLLCKPVLRGRVSKKWQYYIWLVVIARLLLPFSPGESLTGTLFERVGQAESSVVTAGRIEAEGIETAEMKDDFSDKTENILPRDDDASEKGDRAAQTSKNGNDSEDAFDPSGENKSVGASIPRGIPRYLWVLWFGTALLLLTWKIAGYHNFVKYVRAGGVEVSDIKLLDLLAEIEGELGIRRHVELYTNSLVPTPILFGFFRPCIILPDPGLPEKDFRYTALHELVHCRRCDILYKWLMQVTVCLHWFNPLVWLMGREVEAACELACDEAVIGRLDEEERIFYGDTLLRALEDRRGSAGSSAVMTLSEGGKLLKERLKAILHYRGSSKMVRTASVLLAGAMAFGAVLTGAASGGTPKKSAESGSVGNPEDGGGFPHTEESGILQKAPEGSSRETPDDTSGGEVSWETLELKGTTYYLVFDEAQLRAIGSEEAELDKNYMQQADIRMSSEDWVPIGTEKHPFTGSFNGNGYEITGLTMTDPEAELTGLFGAAKDAHIYNVILRDCDMMDGGSAGKSKESFDLEEVLGLDLGGVRLYDCIVYPKNKAENEKGRDREAEAYYDDGNLPMFENIFSLLDESEQRKWLERFYDEGETAFFSVASGELDKDSPLIGEFAERAYADGAISFFSILADDQMSEEQLEAWLERAVSDGQISFQSVLLGALGRDREQDALEEELDRQRLEEYERYGLSMEGKACYYQGQLVNVFLDHMPGSRSYLLNINPAGTVNVKVLRDTDGSITGMDYMTKEEAERFLGGLYDEEPLTATEDVKNAGMVTVPVDIAKVNDGAFM